MFKDIDFKNNEDFEKASFKTPESHRCVSYISRKANETLGSMVIVEVDNVETYQFVHGMPKLYYYGKLLKQLENEENLKGEFREKLDGTNICIYPIKDPETNEILEIVPKTRNMPTLNGKFQKFYDKTKNPELENLLKTNPKLHSVMFELWGRTNHHGIRYPNGDHLNLSLLCGYDANYNLLSLDDLFKIINLENVKTPEVLGEFRKDSDYHVKLYANKQENQTSIFNEDIEFNGSLKEVFNETEQYYESLNTEYKEENHSFNLEGVVINTKINGRNHLLKLKPPSIAESYRLAHGIGAFSIKKEIKKYIDEFGKETLEEKFRNNRDEVINYIEKQLEEEYKREYVKLNQTTKRIKRLIKEELQGKASESEIKSIAEDIKDENPDAELKDLMKIFGKEYPEFKHKSKDVFNILKGL